MKFEEFIWAGSVPRKREAILEYLSGGKRYQNVRLRFLRCFGEGE